MNASNTTDRELQKAVQLIEHLTNSLRTFSNNVPDGDKAWTTYDEAVLTTALDYLAGTDGRVK
jgi:hypothetical protein